jgi:Protein of unknown function (DUF1501)
MRTFGHLSRRDWLQLSVTAALYSSVSGWFGALAAEGVRHPQRRRSCILLWMDGGPSQLDTFDLKPGHANGGPFREIATSVPGIRISEHLPKVARHMGEVTLVRSMTSKEGDHGLANYYAHAGYSLRGPIHYPTLGALLAKESSMEIAELPGFVSIAPSSVSAHNSPGFLGPRYAPLVIKEPGPDADASALERALQVANLRPQVGVSAEQLAARLRLAREMQWEFVAQHAGAVPQGQATAFERAARLMSPQVATAFDLDREPTRLRDAYGRGLFGQGCLLARRLVERGVAFVEISLSSGAWDTHRNNFETVRSLSAVLDTGWSALLSDLKDRGLLQTTLIVWMGEFGRTPRINSQRGRDHYPNAWTAGLAGGGIKGGQVVGRTSAGGEAVEERPVSVPDLLATVCRALSIEPSTENMSNTGRPVRIVDASARPILEVLA